MVKNELPRTKKFMKTDSRFYTMSAGEMHGCLYRRGNPWKGSSRRPPFFTLVAKSISISRSMSSRYRAGLLAKPSRTIALA